MIREKFRSSSPCRSDLSLAWQAGTKLLPSKIQERFLRAKAKKRHESSLRAEERKRMAREETLTLREQKRTPSCERDPGPGVHPW
jgi:hypothetical protein